MSRPVLLNALCNPPDNVPFDADRIARDVERVLGALALVEHRADLRFEELPNLLRTIRPTVFHFIGHGLPDGRLVMKDRDGATKGFLADATVEALLNSGQPPALVVLSACHSAPLAAPLIAGGVRCVVATTDRTPDTAVGAFSKAFFEALAAGSTVEDAFSTGRTAVRGEVEGAEQFFVLKGQPGHGSLRFFAPVAAPATSLDEVRQYILWLDVDAEQPSEAEVKRQLPAERRDERLWLRLSAFNGPRLDRDREAVNVPWEQLARAIAALGRALRQHRQSDPLPVRYYVVGRAPLAAFVQLGFEVSAWGAPVTLLNTRKEGVWDRIDLDGPVLGVPFFDRREGLEGRSVAQGRLDLYVSCAGDEWPPCLDDLTLDPPEPRAGRILLSTLNQKFVDSLNGPDIAAELVAAFSSLRTHWPEHGRLTISVRGPATLAFMVGRALNARMEEAWLTDFAGKVYRLTWMLPFRDDGAPRTDLSPVDAGERLRTLNHLRAGIDRFRRHARAEHLLPPRAFAAPGGEAESWAEKALDRLQRLEVSHEPGADPFEISVVRQRLSFGEALLEGLRGLDPDRLGRVGALFVLHELIHFDQRLTGRIYRGVSRAGVVLEQIDHQADAFALAALTRVELARGGADAQDRCGDLLAAGIDAHLAAMMAFDRMEQGARFSTLMERRLRRYLLWALQRARAETARTPADVERILGERIYAELAPIRGSLSGAWDKVAEAATGDTQLFVALGARLIRLPPLPQNFAPAELIALVKTFQWEALCEAMATVVELAPAELVPWVG